jgi:hypothetical protein
LKGVWLQPLPSEKPGFKVCFRIQLVYRYKPVMRDGRVSVTSPGDIGVIAPYAAQVRVLQELWWGCTSCIQLSHSLKAPGFNP